MSTIPDTIANNATMLALAPGSKIRSLSVIGYANGFTSWHFRADTDGYSLAQITSPGFFHTAQDLIASGDFVWISGKDFGGTGFFFHEKGQLVLKLLART